MVNNQTIQIRKAIWQIPALIVLAAITAIGTNVWRSDGIPLVGDWSVEARFIDPEVLCSQQNRSNSCETGS